MKSNEDALLRCIISFDSRTKRITTIKKSLLRSSKWLGVRRILAHVVAKQIFTVGGMFRTKLLAANYVTDCTRWITNEKWHVLLAKDILSFSLRAVVMKHRIQLGPIALASPFANRFRIGGCGLCVLTTGWFRGGIKNILQVLSLPLFTHFGTCIVADVEKSGSISVNS